MGRKERLELFEPSVRELTIIKIVCGFNSDELLIGGEKKIEISEAIGMAAEPGVLFCFQNGGRIPSFNEG